MPGAVIVKGWFEDTVPRFFQELSATGSVLGLIHIDSDIFVSKNCVERARKILQRVYIFVAISSLYLVFDELINYPNLRITKSRLCAVLLETDDFIMCELIGSDQR